MLTYEQGIDAALQTGDSNEVIGLMKMVRSANSAERFLRGYRASSMDQLGTRLSKLFGKPIPAESLEMLTITHLRNLLNIYAQTDRAQENAENWGRALIKVFPEYCQA